VKERVGDFALFGGERAFAEPLHVAQLNFPPWDKVEEAFRGIFTRRYFANHGPLVRELDERFAEFVGAEHAVSVTNGTVALTIMARSLELSGEVIVPAFTFPASAQALSWAGLKPALCDVDRRTHMITPETIEPHVGPRTAGILGVHLWGRPCMPERLEEFAARRGLALFFDACHAIGCRSGGRRIGTFGRAEAFSFHATKIVNGGEGGCVTTNDSRLADRLRTMRNFHPSETYAGGMLRMNGKMSEAQAALALLSLDDYDRNAAANRRRFQAYQEGMRGIKGISLLPYEPANEGNCQYIVVEVDEEETGVSRDTLLDLLSAENVLCRRHFYPGVNHMAHYSSPSPGGGAFPGSEALCRSLLQLPNGQNVTEGDALTICGLMESAIRLAGPIRAKTRVSP
jgi:dTDP-4-amino-4,6-dideoxygalactose transaminase